ncbi:uncharacterized protein [Miscanthus floridulus]|uniref:uncharacterized protein isoform X2 n=1 Tax=Miscanthus floridulus TaxID=154761 RepID=UPI003459CC57
MTRGGGGDMKSFFRQQKAHASTGATKPTGGVSKKAAAAAHQHEKAAPALHVHPSPGTNPNRSIRFDSSLVTADQQEERERAAREFDMDMRYGPCLGVTRAQRWRRAAELGLAPPPALLALCTDDQLCLWEGRV